MQRNAFRFRALIGAGLLVILGLTAPQTAEACELCYWSWLNPSRSYCKIVQEGQTGTTRCDTFVGNLGDSYCTEGGDFCSVITAGGGGGGGGSAGGGGGTNPCQTSGFCPAECFTCGGGGGGGRPAT